ncbi:MAG: ornithine cyclodeaminase family protein [Mesorhizobium sp.]|nr:MAG: ornithine cyclodeaminase family protein [Mesorhizobium sp.]
MKPIYIDYLNALDIEALDMTDAEIVEAVEAGLVAQGNGQTVIEPRVHLEPDPSFNGHFNVLRGYVAPLDAAGVKIVGDYVDNYLHGLPSEFGILNLFDPRTGTPRADIVVEASRLPEPQPLLKTAWIKPGGLVMPYGTMSAVELSLTDIMAKIVVDDWGQCKGGKFGSLRAHVETGRLSEQTLYAELGQIAAGLKPGRQSDDETILFWHRGLSLSDIALGKAMLAKAQAQGIGQRLRFA